MTGWFLRLFYAFRELEANNTFLRRESDQLKIAHASAVTELAQLRMSADSLRSERDAARESEMTAMRRSQDWQCLCNGMPQIWGTVPEKREEPIAPEDQATPRRKQIRDLIAQGEQQFKREFDAMIDREWQSLNT